MRALDWETSQAAKPRVRAEDGRARARSAKLAAVSRSGLRQRFNLAYFAVLLGAAFAACGAPRSSNQDGSDSKGDDSSDDLNVGDGPSGTGAAGGLCSETGTCSCIRLALFGTLDSKAIDKVEVIRSNKVRRAKLFYIRALKGKAARLKEVDQTNA